MTKGLGQLSDKKRLREACLAWRGPRGDLTNAYKYLKGINRMGPGCFPPGCEPGQCGVGDPV